MLKLYSLNWKLKMSKKKPELKMRGKIDKSQKEIDDLTDKCDEFISKGASKFPAMSYEEGIRNAIDWITGDSDDNPMED